MEFKDYYNMLGVDESATADEIKKAYRKQARKYHPDVSQEADAEAKFKDMGEAYEVLGDPDKRAEYDRLRQIGARGRDGRFQPPPDWEPAPGFDGSRATEGDTSGFSDFFETLFGHGERAHRTSSRASSSSGSSFQRNFRMKGEDTHYRLPLYLEEAYRGVERQVQFQVPVSDVHGFVAYQQKALNVKIPAGVTQGQKIRLRGQGAPGIAGGEAGDLFLEIELREHPLFSVEGKDLTLTLPISPWEAALGATVQVPTLGGPVNLKIPAQCQTGQKLRLKGRGLPGQPAGDQYIALQVVMPEKTNARARELFEQLAQELPFNPREKLEV
jgi:curved DNA-binding protein